VSEDWRDILKQYRNQPSRDPNDNRLAGPSNTTSSRNPTSAIGSARPVPSASSGQRLNGGIPAIDVHLGIDFGTRFTKVGIFLPHIQKRDILNFKGVRLFPSRIALSEDERLYFVNCPGGAEPKLLLEYLKIRLANPAAEAFGTTVSISGVPFSDGVKSLSAFYLASILRLAKAAAKQMFPAELAADRTVNWFANVGVPVKHCDSDTLKVFKEVSAVAWLWHTRQPWAPRMSDLMIDYESTNVGADLGELRIQVAPELAAALIHFAERPNTAPGFYGFLDIGGGTLDGSVFRLRRDEDGAHFDILSADVDELGTMAAARHVVADAHHRMSDIVEKPLITGGVSPKIALPIKPELEERIQTLFASVVGQARRKINNHFFSDEDPVVARPGLNGPRPPIIPVYLAGGGCPSEWYRTLFKRTYDEFGHHAWGIGGYHFQTVPPPQGLNNPDFPRFVIAVGLTSEALHFDKYKLPSRTSPPPPKPQRIISVPVYEGH
jgi:hypothetical protein